MSADALHAPSNEIPEHLSWDELQQLPEQIAAQIELWDRKIIWNRRGPLEHQQYTVRMRNALEADARRAMDAPADDDTEHCWQGVQMMWSDLVGQAVSWYCGW